MSQGVYVRTEETRRIASEALMGYKHTEETKRNMSERMIRRFEDPKERKRMSEAQLGTNPKYPNGTPEYWWQLSRKTWENYHGRTIPEWGLCHHWDWDITNIDPKNLGLLKKSHHQQIHGKKIKGGSLKELIPLLIEKEILKINK